MTADQILREFDIRLGSIRPGNNYAVCPICSSSRLPAHRRLKCLSVLIDGSGVRFMCHNCGHHGGKFYEGDQQGGGALVRVPRHQHRDRRPVRDFYGP
jgi:hypothetical protein